MPDSGIHGGNDRRRKVLAEKWIFTGLDVLTVFRRIGLLYGGIIVFAAIPLRFPNEASRQPSPIKFAILTKDQYFWGLFSGIFAGTFAGLLIIGNLKPLILANGIDSMTATIAISTFAVGNFFGRIMWGWVADHLKALSIPCH